MGALRAGQPKEQTRAQCARLAGVPTVTAPYISGCPTVAPEAGTPYASFSRCH